MAVNTVTDMLRSGIESCRRGDWNEGLRNLGRIAAMGEEAGTLPGIFYSYLGYGIARKEKRIQEGLKLCQHSIEVEFFQAENYLNLARTHLLAKDRKAAVKAVRAGLKIDRSNRELLALYRELGIRSRPVLPFLSRGNLLNQLLGRLRHAWKGDK
ncbi:MAG TPA: hypothetical protein VGX68_09975 [Thermoanaerobaculia bacterium]|jgi:uncharacterized protein HemY|nr:hypothetical protein [Thermoanaerobaculia bacterium]